MDNVARWKTWLRDNGDLLTQVYSTADIRRAKREGKTGIILGWQNLSGIEDRIDYLPLFHALGVKVMQVTYNTQNLVGSGCYESTDSGLSDFGHDVVAEMNRLGILCDLSHVGAQTSRDVIQASKKPCAYTHCAPAALKKHPRNKSDDQLRAIVRKGGFVGVTMFPAFLKRGPGAKIGDYVEAMEYVIRRCGEDQVGIGTDFTQGHGAAFFDWITRDKGYGRRLVTFGPIINPAGIRRIEDYPKLTAAMRKRRWKDSRIRKVMGENWIRFLDDVWQSPCA
jgi:membrane dipeptidase